MNLRFSAAVRTPLLREHGWWHVGKAESDQTRAGRHAVIGSIVCVPGVDVGGRKTRHTFTHLHFVITTLFLFIFFN